MSKHIKSCYTGGNLFNDDVPIPVESSDFHNIAKSTNVVNISPIAVSAQEILSFARVDGSTMGSKPLVCDTLVISRCSDFLKKI